MDGLDALVVVHVLSALIGIGPTFFGHVLLRKNQTLPEYRASFAISNKLMAFPKTGGPVAVLSGIALILLRDYGSFTQLWLLGSLLVFVGIQIVTAAAAFPAMKKVSIWLNDPQNQSASSLPQEQSQSLRRASGWMYVASALGILLFILMITKPA